MQVAVLSFLIYICYCGSSPSTCSVKSYTLEGFVDFTGEQICRGFFCIEREALAQVFSCWFRGIFRGAFFIEHLAPTASVTKNTGVTNKTAQDNSKHGRSYLAYVLFRMYDNVYTSLIFLHLYCHRGANTDWLRSAKWKLEFGNKK